VVGGVSVFDIDNVVIPQYEKMVAKKPEITFEEVYDKLLFQYDGKGVSYRTMSPRVFEAAAVRSCQILFEGRYSGILKPMVHYIPLKKDFSNFEEVMRMYRDESLRRELTENCYRDLIASGRYSYREFIRGFDEGLQGAGIKPGIPEEVEHRVTELLSESRRSLLVKKVEVQQREYQELMNKHVALQVQYTQQQRQLQELIAEKSALRMQSMVGGIGVDIAKGMYSARGFIANCGRSGKAFVANALRPYPFLYKVVRSIWKGFRKPEGKW